MRTNMLACDGSQLASPCRRCMYSAIISVSRQQAQHTGTLNIVHLSMDALDRIIKVTSDSLSSCDAQTVWCVAETDN